MAENEDVLVNVENGVGLITLNRPKAINSLTHPMVNAISKVLTDWEHDDDIPRWWSPAPVSVDSAPGATSW